MMVNLAVVLAIVYPMLSVVVAVIEKCGYEPGPVVVTNDRPTVVINFNCSQSTPVSRLQLRDDVTHVAVQLVHCHTMPVGLFTNVTASLTSVTVASEDAVQLLDGTFEGLELAEELRLLGFTRLTRLGRSLLQPLRNIRTLILDSFGRNNIELSYLGGVIQQLSGTPITRLVLHNLKVQGFYQHILKVDHFRIANASVKELFVTETPVNYEGSIRRAFPDLIRFCGSRVDQQTDAALPTIYDLIFLSDQLEEVTLYRPDILPYNTPNSTAYPATKLLQFIFRAARHFPELISYFVNRSREINLDCEYKFTAKLGANVSKVVILGFTLWIKAEKPICFDQDNNLTRIDFTECHFPGTVPVFIGFKKLEYFSLENTGIRKLPVSFLQYLPSLKVLRLSENNNLDDFIKNVDGDFFGSCPTLADIYLDGCNLTKISSTIFSRSFNLRRLDVSKNYLHTFDVDLQNCTMLDVLNLSHNSVGSIAPERINQLTQLALRKRGGNKLLVDLSYNRLHCLCNSTHFIQWLQRPSSDTNVDFHEFDRYTCLYPNGSVVHVSEVNVGEVERHCSVTETLVNGSNCPCDEVQRSRLEQVWVHLEGFFCENDAGDMVSMMSQPLPGCFNPYTRATFIAPVVVGGILGIVMLIAVSLLVYHRNTRRVKQVRECLEMNPVRFLRFAIQYAISRNHAEELSLNFRHHMIVFVQDEDRSRVHNHFIEELHGKRSFVTRDDFLPGVAKVEAMSESIRVCRWIVPVITANFLSDAECVDFVNRVQFSRPHALVPIIWEQPLEVTEVSVVELLRTNDPLYWPGDPASPENKRNFWTSLLERTTPLSVITNN